MAKGRPAKPIALVKGHRTKAEKKVREEAEKKLLTGSLLKEWDEVKANEVAHKEFMRLKKLLKSINHDDDLYGAAINTHCKLIGEEHQLVKARDEFLRTIDELESHKEDMEFLDYIKTKAQVQGQVCYCDKAIMQKRKMMLDISKENVMTIQSALRSIPKKPEETKGKSAMASFLAQRGGVNAT